jgi:hypothetical protein
LKERKCGESGERCCSFFSLSLLKALYASERAAAAAERESASFPRVEVEREREKDREVEVEKKKKGKRAHRLPPKKKNRDSRRGAF